MSDVLHVFDPVIAAWFQREIGEPTPVQELSWPVIAAGEHVLATAPTGSGKTLAAFLWALNQLFTGVWHVGATRVLYVSPLKALNNDVQKNLLAPLASITDAFHAAGQSPPAIHVETRSGDTPSSVRQRMLRNPPEILITTPESLNLILSSDRSRRTLGGVQQVILDEIHAVAGNKRGTHLITAIDRLVPLAGDFQRIALSATVRPMEAIAEFVGGYQVTAGGPDKQYRARSVRIISAPQSKQYAIRVSCPDDATETEDRESSWPALASRFKAHISENRATLLFVNSRRLCERITAMLNEGEPGPLAFPHHGSLAREMRLAVEQKLKDGALRAIVATGSLELGIDIGELDEVLLVQTPFSVSSALQRVGRAGHQVGEVSRGVLYPTHGHDFLQAAVMARCIVDQDIESIRAVDAPLDVLTQVIVSMVSIEPWDLDALYDLIRTSSPYHGLSRGRFDLVVQMLAGAYQDSRIRALRPLVSVDRLNNSIVARDNAVLLLRMSGGTIPDRGYFDLRKEDDRAKLGELDEEFVWERSLGHTFIFGNRSWTIRAITDNEVLVSPAHGKQGEMPFWKADESDGSHHFAERLGVFLEQADGQLESPAFRQQLERDCFMDPPAACALIDFLKRQKGATGAALPHGRHVLAEWYDDHRPDSDSQQIILHTVWGGKVNRPYALALSQAYEERFGVPLEVFSNNEAVVAVLPHSLPSRELIGLVTPGNLDGLLRRKLERTGFFGARFRENAARALLLPRRGFGKRMPLWMNRLRGRKLLESIARYTDFPLLLETWRTCLQDEFELPALIERLDEIAAGEIRITECHSKTPSPFAGGIMWRQTNKYMYLSDGALEGGISQLDRDLIKEAVHSAELRPDLDPELVDLFVSKLHRVYPGYAPESARELVDWVKERRFIPALEWERLLQSISDGVGENFESVVSEASNKLAWIQRDGRDIGVIAQEQHEATLSVWSPSTETAELASWLEEWLRNYGPLTESDIGYVLPVARLNIEAAIASLAAERLVVVDHLTAGASELEICDAENLERLLRLTRRAARIEHPVCPVAELPLRLAQHQGLLDRSAPDAMERAVERLLGYPIPAAELERAILPSRVECYRSEQLDELLQATGAMWYGCGLRKIAFGIENHFDLFGGWSGARAETDTLFPDMEARYSYASLLDRSGLSSAELTKCLWDGVWWGVAANDGYGVVRQGLANGFKPPELPNARSQLTRGSLSAWKQGRPNLGHWYALPRVAKNNDVLDQEALRMERARMVLNRYGVVFRSLTNRESPPFRWGQIFPALRRLELSGEIFAGNFVDGITELQFASREFLSALKDSAPHEAVYWLSAIDPASLCGLEIPAIKSSLPQRTTGAILVYRGNGLAIVVRNGGAKIEIHLDSDDGSLVECLECLLEPLVLRDDAFRANVATINGVDAARSPFLPAMKQVFEVERGPRGVTLRRASTHPASR